MENCSYTIKVENGYAKVFDEKGVFKRYICGNAVKAELKGSKVLVTTRDNKLKRYNLEIKQDDTAPRSGLARQ